MQGVCIVSGSFYSHILIDPAAYHVGFLQTHSVLRDFSTLLWTVQLSQIFVPAYEIWTSAQFWKEKIETSFANSVNNFSVGFCGPH